MAQPKEQQFPDEEINMGGEISLVQSYIRDIEAALSSDELKIIDEFLDEVVHNDDGSFRDYNSIAGDIMLYEQHTQLIEVADNFREKTRSSFKNYLITKADILVYGDGAPGFDKSGVFHIVKGVGEATKDVLLGDEKQPKIKADEEISPDKQEEKEYQHIPVSEMDLEGLLSKETVGSIKPNGFGQCNYNFNIPDLTGFKEHVFDSIISKNQRHMEQMSVYDIRDYDMQLEFPVWRIKNGVLPVPPKYYVVGLLDQPMTVIDPSDENPFCTRMVSDVEASTVRYVVSPLPEPLRVKKEEFAPSHEEISALRQNFPLPDEEFQKGSIKNIYTAIRTVSNYMEENYIYLCDDRLGKFIRKHSNELCTIVQGLKVGHCDQLAWAAANYFRQLGFSAVVVNTEYSNNSGTAFLKGARHSRVAIINDNGVITYFDPTNVCEEVDGYGLSNIDDATIDELDQRISTARNKSEKIEILSEFREMINDKQPLKTDAARRLEDKVTVRGFDVQSLLSDIDLNDDDVMIVLEDIFGAGKHSEEAKIEINKLCDLLAANNCPLFRDCIGNLKQTEQVNSYIDKGYGDQLFSHMKFDPYRFVSDIFRKLNPHFIEYIDERLSEGDYSNFIEHQEYNVSKLNLPAAVSFLPDKKQVMTFKEDFNPLSIENGDENISSDAFIEYILFLKLVAIALTDAKAKAVLKKRFGMDENDLKRYAQEFERRLLPDSKPKKIVKNIQEFSGKTNKRDYKKFHDMSKNIANCFDVNEEERKLASKKLLAFLGKLPLKAEADKRWESAEEVDYIEYDRNLHGSEQIDKSASDRAGKLMVRINKIRPKVKQIHINIDIDFFDFESAQMFSLYARSRVVVETLIKYAKLKRVIVNVSSDNNDYYLIDPKKPPDIDVLAFRLAVSQIDRPLDDNYGFQTTKGLPKNMVYLSANSGKVNAVKSVLGKRTNVAAKTFSDVGLDIFSRLKTKKKTVQGKSVRREGRRAA